MALKNAFADLALESTANTHLVLVNVEITDLLHRILVQLEIANKHNEYITENVFTEEDVNNGDY